MAFKMTGAVAESVRRDQVGQPDQIEALDIALDALTRHSVAQGSQAGVDVETLFSAVQMLAHADELEVAPFVRTWSNCIERLIERPLLYPDQNDDTRGASAYGALERSMVRALRRVVLESQGAVDYLMPLLELTELGPANIVTLNYDRTIETLAAQHGVAVDDGVYDDGVEGAWRGGLDWHWKHNHAGIRLLKLHGSADWLLSSPTWPDTLTGDKARRMTFRRVIRMYASDDPGTEYGRSSPAMIFGRRGKLRSEGPYLAMLSEFARILREDTDRLVVIGYSFRDDHVNDPIREWFNAMAVPRVTVVDPVLCRHPLKVEPGFADDLFRSLAHDAKCTAKRYRVDESRHRIIAEGAGKALPMLW